MRASYDMNLWQRVSWLMILMLAVGAGLGLAYVENPGKIVVITFALLAGAISFLFKGKNWWQYAFWFVLSGMTIWSFGFINVPLVKPIPLAEALLILSVISGFKQWSRLYRIRIIRNLVIFLLILDLVIGLRLLVDFPRWGLFAARDALFGVELWFIFPAIVIGYQLGDDRLEKRLSWLFIVSLLWFVLYLWRTWLMNHSPVFGIQRPVPLFQFHTAIFLATPLFVWYLARRDFFLGIVGASASVFILLVVQSRYAFLSFILSVGLVIFLRPSMFPRLVRVAIAGLLVVAILSIIGPLPGRMNVPVGIESVTSQLGTLFGKEGPGAGSLKDRLEVWPKVIKRVLDQPFGPIRGIGLGPDLYIQGFKSFGGVLVRKPHNDYLEIWARLGMLGFLPWFGILISLGWMALKSAKRSSRDTWVLSLQTTMWIAAAGEPAFGTGYLLITWAGLTGLWLGAQLRENQQTVRVPLAQSKRSPRRSSPRGG